MIIRERTEKDFHTLVDLMIATDRTEEWATKRVQNYLNKKDKNIFVAEQNNNLVGYVGIKEFDLSNYETRQILGKEISDLACLTWIAVHPDFRRKGVATAVLICCDSFANERNKQGIWLDCREKIMQLYNKSGYYVAGSYVDGECDRYVLIKKIKK